MKTKIFIISKVNDVNFVLTPDTRKCARDYPIPNFMNTGMALVGVLKENETLEEFELRQTNMHDLHLKENTKLFLYH